MTSALVRRVEAYTSRERPAVRPRMRLRWDRIVGMAVVFVLAACIVALGVTVRDLRHQVDVLNRACGPVYTGGGVTQCAQPTVKP